MLHASRVRPSFSVSSPGREVTSGVSKLDPQIAVDMAAIFLKEFWPDF
jgi:hypothetical protein